MQLSVPFCLTPSGSDLAVAFVFDTCGHKPVGSTRDITVVEKSKDQETPLLTTTEYLLSYLALPLLFSAVQCLVVVGPV